MTDFKCKPKSNIQCTTAKPCIYPPLPRILSPDANFERPKKLSPMERLRRTLSFRSKAKENACTPSITKENKKVKKPLTWLDDEKAVRVGTCSFKVKYLGSVEVHESRGMYVCEQGIQTLLNQKSKHIKAILHISGDALRVVDETNKGLIVDQTIEKVSFCAPDRHHGKGFAYIYRDGTTRRWLCHGFLAIKDTGERLSHTVGCAFQICLERKQKRNRECDVKVEYTQNGTSFTRFGSFRTTPVTERTIDYQSAGPIPCSLSNKNNYIIERPRPKGNDSDAFSRSPSMQSPDLNQIIIDAFKRQTSLKSSDLPSIEETKYEHSLTNTLPEEVKVVSKIPLFNSTNTNNNHRQISFPVTKSPIVALPSTSQSIIPEQAPHTNTTMLISNAFDSNLSALVQSNYPINPFSPYGYSMAAQAQSPDINSRQSSIFTPKRGTNPFDDDLIRR